MQAGSGGPKLHSIDAEEALIAAMLLHDDFDGLSEFTDDEVWHDHLRPIIATARARHVAGKPCGTVFILAALEPQLDSLSWRGDTGEDLVLDILSRRVGDVQSYYSRQLGRLVRYYAERRKAIREAQEAAQRTFTETFDAARKRYEGEL